MSFDRLRSILETILRWRPGFGRTLAGPYPVPVSARGRIVAQLDRNLLRSRKGPLTTAAMVVEIDDFATIEVCNTAQDVEKVIAETQARLHRILRQKDMLCPMDNTCTAIALSPLRRLDLEAAIRLSAQIQHAMAEPIRGTRGNISLTVSIGFALSDRIDRPSGTELFQAARIAQIEARRHGPGAVRSFSNAMEARINARSGLSAELESAIASGAIQAFFQPQISLSTREISGFEALARWHHDSRGLIPPAEFLPVLEEAGMMRALGMTILRQSLAAMRDWDRAGLPVPRVSVNMSTDELRNPCLVEAVAMELDAFDMAPARLVIEVLETVVADKNDDTIIRNLAGLADLGCTLDLDDFGTGNAAITAIRRFAIHRIKIDRSFVTGIDSDPEQQQMVAAILTMADRLALETLAEGVETDAELDQIVIAGCGHAQGFAIARPMPATDVVSWVRARVFGAAGQPRLRFV